MLKESDDLYILGVTFDSKMTFEKHIFLGFQSSLLKCWYLEEVLASISELIAPWEMFSGVCPASFGVLFCRVVLGCRYTP